MADLYTVTRPPGGESGGYACNGRVDRAKAIKEARAHFQRQFDVAKHFLACQDHEYEVKVVRGYHRETLVQVLEPEGWVVVNSKGDRIGPTYPSQDAALGAIAVYGRDKRGAWVPYEAKQLFGSVKP